MSNRAICASMKSSFTVNGVEISAGLIGLPQAQRPFGIIAHARVIPCRACRRRPLPERAPPRFYTENVARRTVSDSLARTRLQASRASIRCPVFGFQAAIFSSRS